MKITNIANNIQSSFKDLLNEIENIFELFIYSFLMDDGYIEDELKPMPVNS
jgi:hypothetical protein